MTDDEEVKFEDGGQITAFSVVKPCLYVAVFHYPGGDQVWGATDYDKQRLISTMLNYHGLDKARPVRIYTIML